MRTMTFKPTALEKRIAESKLTIMQYTLRPDARKIHKKLDNLIKATLALCQAESCIMPAHNADDLTQIKFSIGLEGFYPKSKDKRLYLSLLSPVQHMDMPHFSGWLDKYKLLHKDFVTRHTLPIWHQQTLGLPILDVAKKYGFTPTDIEHTLTLKAVDAVDRFIDVSTAAANLQYSRTRA